MEKAYSLDPKISHSLKNNNINYLLARAYHLNYEFDKAINKYKEQMENHLIKIGDCVGKIDPRVCSE